MEEITGYEDLNLTEEEKVIVKRLEETLKDGAYDLSTEGMMFLTGKKGYIRFEIALRREVEKYGNNT